MSLKFLTVLSGIGGLSGMTLLPLANSSTLPSTLTSNNLTNIENAQAENDLYESNFTIKIVPTKSEIHESTYGLNTFPVGFMQNLTPGLKSSIPLSLAWNQAKALKNQAASNGWKTWGYTAASLIAKGSGSNGVVAVEAQLTLSPLVLTPFILDLGAAAHGTPTTPLTGTLKTKVVSLGNALAVQVYYVNLAGIETFVIQSNPIPPIAAGAVLAYVGSLTTTDFHS